MVGWTLIPFFKFYENKLAPMKAKSDPKRFFVADLVNVERRYLDLSVILTVVQDRLTLNEKGKLNCIQRIKQVLTWPGLWRKKKTEEKEKTTKHLNHSVQNSSLHTDSHRTHGNTIMKGNSLHKLTQLQIQWQHKNAVENVMIQLRSLSDRCPQALDVASKTCMQQALTTTVN